MSTFTPSTLYYASALINLLTIPKHFLVGQQHVCPAVDAIPSTPDLARGKSVAFTTWEYAMGALFVSGTSICHYTDPISVGDGCGMEFGFESGDGV
jgi:hypothetical protein